MCASVWTETREDIILITCNPKIVIGPENREIPALSHLSHPALVSTATAQSCIDASLGGKSRSASYGVERKEAKKLKTKQRESAL